MSDTQVEKKVLVVDDEQPILKMLRVLFSASGYTPYCSPDGNEALKIMAEQGIRVVFTDLRMTAMDGMTLCRRAKELDPQAHVFAVSAYVRKYSDAQFAEAGFDGHYQKPFTAADLIGACDAAFAELEQRDREA